MDASVFMDLAPLTIALRRIGSKGTIGSGTGDHPDHESQAFLGALPDGSAVPRSARSFP